VGGRQVDSCNDFCVPRLLLEWGILREMENKMEKIKVQPSSCAGFLWFGGWIFTIGYLHLSFWKGVLAILLWTYYLGAHFSSMAR